MYDSLVSSVIDEFKKQRILDRTDYTFVEYVDNLEAFQFLVAKMVIGDTATKDVRMSEVISYLEAMAREKNIAHDPEVFRGMNTLRLIQKEIAVAKSGKNAENRVANTFQYVTRPDAQFYRNMYITDGQEETEMDAVVLTKNGIMILEVKSAKEDITLAPDGRILFNNSSCYHDTSVGEKMEKKQRLLKKRLEEELYARGIETKVEVDGLLVFSTPKGVHIRVTNQFHQINYCFRGNLFNRIDSYAGSADYSDKEMEIIASILQTVEKEQKRFLLKFDLEEAAADFAKALVKLTMDEQVEEAKPIIEEVQDAVDIDMTTYHNKKQMHDERKRVRKLAGVFYAGTAAAACCMIVPALSVGASLAGGVLTKIVRG